ncbi:AbrB/MazE/SpoVT family DNA-binding domain-containing protein [Clostridium beijerinckii]|uniref:AbrB/MazE/SpoVT family DNA-binding domain-containing protein n=1 Tax=Clostridium beijerinckii TaxID=1520 RepID=UPI00156F726C|nr:AbrB/MazE/SpoVT family DNA-binding domain-containing protein [Clostridium beijerinckii]NRT71407.1 transcriptional pleiotropic regulator of transition state genes [Clostridium beijerinckii]
MKESGIVRKLDNLGRIVIPKEIRYVMGINCGDSMEMIQVDNQIVVKKYSKGCIFCGSNNSNVEFKNLPVCKECKEALKKD